MLGIALIQVRIHNAIVYHPFLIAETAKANMLGIDLMNRLGLILEGNMITTATIQLAVLGTLSLVWRSALKLPKKLSSVSPATIQSTHGSSRIQFI